MNEPERGVNGVVFGFVASVGKTVGNHPFAEMLGEGAQDFTRHVKILSREREARQPDHRVTSPIREPVIASDGGSEIASATNDELRRCDLKRARKLITFPARHLSLVTALQGCTAGLQIRWRVRVGATGQVVDRDAGECRVASAHRDIHNES